MKPLRMLLLTLVAVLSVGAFTANAAPTAGKPIAAQPTTAPPTDECNGIQQCARADGPWVIVPSQGWAQYLLDCPGRRGIAGGVAALVSTQDIHVMWQAELSAPIAPGRSSSRYVFFRAISAHHRIGAFKPRAGCIPVGTQRSTYVSVPGAPLSYAATTIKLKPGTAGRSTIGCIPGQVLVDSWTAVAFRTEALPRLELAQGVRVTRSLVGKKVSVSISVSEALPRKTGLEVQLGVMCAPS